MEFARNVLISATCLKHKTVFRFAFLRSDLFRHHIEINPSNLPVPQCFNVQILLCESVAYMMRFVRSLVSEDGPGDSRHFVCQGHRHYVCWTSRLHFFLPCAWRLGVTQNRTRPMDQQGTQVWVTSPGNRAQPDLSAGTILTRNKSQKRCKLATGPECLRISNCCHQGRCSQAADAGHLGDRATCRFVFLPGANPLLELIDVLLKQVD